MSAADRVSTAALLRLLRSKDPEEVAAAALVLRRLKPPGIAVLRALLAALRRAHAHTRPYLIEALASVPGPGACAAMLPLLRGEGAQREQAVTLLAQRRGVLPPLVTWCDELPTGTDKSGAIAVLEKMNSAASLRALLGLLPRADFLTARRVYGVFARATETGTPAQRRDLVTMTLRAWPRVRRNDTARITILKILTVLKPRDARKLLPDALADDALPAVRRAALTLAAALPLRRTDRALRALLQHMLVTPECGLLRADALRCLHNCGAASAAEPHFAMLLQQELPVALAAVELLPHFSPEAARSGLQTALSHKDARITAAAGRMLATHAALMKCNLPSGLTTLASDVAPTANAITLLAASQREHTNTICCERALSALRKNDAETATAWLEPLVRASLASPQCRALLAAAWARLLPTTQGTGTPRCLQLLGPLVRLQGFDTGAALLKEGVLPQADRVHLALLLSKRGKPERTLAARLDPSHRTTR